MFSTLTAFFADLKTHWRDWRAGRIVTVEEAEADPERFVRQLIADTKNGCLWFQDPKDRFAYESYYDKHMLCRLFVTSATFGFEIFHTHYKLQLRGLMKDDVTIYHTAWQGSVMRYNHGEQSNGNMKVRELFELVANRHK